MIDTVATDGVSGYTTYDLSMKLGNSGNLKTIYTIFGDGDNSIELPAAYQEAAPFGANFGGVAPALVTAKPSAEFDSWLSCGFCNHARPETCTYLADGTLGAIGIDFDAWTADTGITVSNGAVFWMAPGDGPTGKAVVAQITTDGDFDAVINAQGRSNGGADDWQARGIAFSSSGGGGGGTT